MSRVSQAPLEPPGRFLVDKPTTFRACLLRPVTAARRWRVVHHRVDLKILDSKFPHQKVEIAIVHISMANPQIFWYFLTKPHKKTPNRVIKEVYRNCMPVTRGAPRNRLTSGGSILDGPKSEGVGEV